jgi:hypothetical protein
MKLSFKEIELLIISIITGIFIYFRKLDYYKTLPRENIYISLIIIIWTYLVIRVSPWFILVGLVVLNLLGFKHDDKDIDF